MGRTAEIHLWFDDFDAAQAARLFGAATDCVAKTDARDPIDGLYNRFLRVVKRRIPHEEGETVDVRSDDVRDVIAAVGERIEADCEYTVESVYQFKTYRTDTRTLEDDLRPLQISVRGPAYSVDQFYWKRSGLLQATFFNTENLAVPPELIHHTRQAVLAKGDHFALMKCIDAVAANGNAMHDLARLMIARLDPRRVLLTSADEIHPLNAHGVYHRNLSDFALDLPTVVQLHTQGGLYAYDGPLKRKGRAGSPQDYGFLRLERGTADALVARLDELSVRFLEREGQLRALPTSEIRRRFEESADTEVVPLRSSVYLQSKDAIFGYVEEPFFSLAEGLLGPS
jgi:hypothetical protein